MEPRRPLGLPPQGPRPFPVVAAAAAFGSSLRPLSLPSAATRQARRPSLLRLPAYLALRAVALEGALGLHGALGLELVLAVALEVGPGGCGHLLGLFAAEVVANAAALHRGRRERSEPRPGGAQQEEVRQGRAEEEERGGPGQGPALLAVVLAAAAEHGKGSRGEGGEIAPGAARGEAGGNP